MCPEPQLISIYIDGELPSPWKEKLENHVTECSVCREKLENFRQIQGLFKKDTDHGKHAELNVMEQELMEASKDKVWKKLQAKQHFRPVVNRQTVGLWQRRFSIPIPAAAAAAVIIALVTALWVRTSPADNANYAVIPSIDPFERSNFILASEEQIPDIIPTSDITNVLQYLGANDTNIIILQLPESKNFFRASEPVIRAADYTRGQ